MELTITGTNLHTDAERVAMQNELMRDALADLRTAEVKKAMRTLQTLRTRRNSERDIAAQLEYKADTVTDEAARERITQDLAYATTQAEMYAYAAEVWGDEIILCMQELRAELADTLVEKFGRAVAFDVADEIREGKL